MVDLESGIKEVELGKHKYRIGYMKADKGSFIRSLLIAEMLKLAQSSDGTETKPDPTAELSGEQTLTLLVTNLSEENYAIAQRHGLGCVARFEKIGDSETAIPVMLANGNFAIKELAYDIDAVSELTLEALKANLGPFFTMSRLQKLLNL
jgi:hypothetical protein